jgi:hypothetical protein
LGRRLTNVDFTLQDRLLNRILEKLIIPFVIKGLSRSDNRLELKLKLVFAVFAELPVGKMIIIPVRLRIMYSPLTNVTGKGFHN